MPEKQWIRPRENLDVLIKNKDVLILFFKNKWGLFRGTEAFNRGGAYFKKKSISVKYFVFAGVKYPKL